MADEIGKGQRKTWLDKFLDSFNRLLPVATVIGFVGLATWFFVVTLVAHQYGWALFSLGIMGGFLLLTLMVLQGQAHRLEFAIASARMYVETKAPTEAEAVLEKVKSALPGEAQKALESIKPQFIQEATNTIRSLFEESASVAKTTVSSGTAVSSGRGFAEVLAEAWMSAKLADAREAAIRRRMNQSLFKSLLDQATKGEGQPTDQSSKQVR